MTWEELRWIHPLLPAGPGDDWYQHPNGGGWIAATAHVGVTPFVSGLVSDRACILGNARIGPRAAVLGNAIVKDHAQVTGDSPRVTGHAKISGHAHVSGRAFVGGNARMHGNASCSNMACVYDNARIAEDALIHGSAYITGNVAITGCASVGGQAVIGGNAVLSGDARMNHAPLMLTLGAITANENGRGELRIGCMCHTFEWWREHGKQAAKEYNMTDHEVGIFRKFLEICEMHQAYQTVEEDTQT